jgi:hypothetical protein
MRPGHCGVVTSVSRAGVAVTAAAVLAVSLTGCGTTTGTPHATGTSRQVPAPAGQSAAPTAAVTPLTGAPRCPSITDVTAALGLDPAAGKQGEMPPGPMGKGPCILEVKPPGSPVSFTLTAGAPGTLADLHPSPLDTVVARIGQENHPFTQVPAPEYGTNATIFGSVYTTAHATIGPSDDVALVAVDSAANWVFAEAMEESSLSSAAWPDPASPAPADLLRTWIRLVYPGPTPSG